MNKMKVDLYTHNWNEEPEHSFVLWEAGLTLKQALHEIKSEESSFSYIYDENISEVDNFIEICSELLGLGDNGYQLFCIEESKHIKRRKQ